MNPAPALLHVPLWFLLAVSDASAAQTAPVPPHCAARVLTELGWRFLPGTGDTLTVAAGTPCQRASRGEARAAGDLTVYLPADPADSPQLRRELAALLQHPATVCAYAFDLGDATRRAVDRLVANPGFRFSALQLGWIGFGAGGAARDGWERIYSFGRGYRPVGSNSAAIAGFYQGRVRAECGVGRQIAQYATQAELYGPAAFDAEFAADEIVIGTFNKLRRTRSILIGSQAGAMTADGRAHKTAAQGRQAFAGLPGFIYHVFDRSTLDDINNQAENFVVYEVSAAAADALRAHEGFEYYNERSREVWALARTLAMDGHRVHEKLLYERDPVLRRSLSPTAQVTVARLDALLADPFFREFRIYVHRQGIRPVGFHIVRLLDRNPRTPFRTELALHNLHTTLFERYLAHRLAECERGTAPTTVPAATRLRP